MTCDLVGCDTDHNLGIAWLAVEINPIIFELIGLGMGDQPRTVR
jgi:hypothetical protein